MKIVGGKMRMSALQPLLSTVLEEDICTHTGSQRGTQAAKRTSMYEKLKSSFTQATFNCIRIIFPK